MSVREKNRKRKREARKGENRGQGGWRGERRRRTRERKGSCGGRLRNDREKEGERERVRNGVRGGRDAGRRSVGYRSVRVLLQRPTGQRITRNSRLDSAEFERAPADLAFLHRFASLCFALASPRLSSPLLSSPLLSSPLSLRGSLVVGIHWDTARSPPSLPVSTRSLQPGYPADSRN